MRHGAPRVRPTEVDLPITCTYDFEIASTKFLHALDDGEIPLVLLFAGSAFLRGDTGMSVAPVAWHADTTFRLPVAVWRQMMDVYFPNSGWVVLSREVLDKLTQYKASRALASWDLAVEHLLKEAQ